jgi:hypothetical protein
MIELSKGFLTSILVGLSIQRPSKKIFMGKVSSWN